MSNLKIRYDKNPTQKEFHDDVSTSVLMYCSGLGGGKTYALCMKMIQLSWLNRPFGGGILSPSYQDFKKDILPTFLDIFERNRLVVKINMTDKTFLFPWSKNYLYVFTAQEAIAGPNLAYCGINEFSLIPEVRINEMMRRVRLEKAPFRQRCMVGTPEDVYGWLDDFIEKGHNHKILRVIKGKTTDNPHLDPEYINFLRATLDPQAFKLFAEGEQLRLGTDYFYYAFSKDNEDKSITIQQYQTVHVGIDFNVGNMHAIFCHKIKNSLYVFDEVVLKGSNDGTHDMARAILNRYHPNQVLITCDASGRARSTIGSTDFEILKGYGFEVRAKTANPRIRKRQLLVNGLLSNKRILINPLKCPILIKDLRKVEQNKATFEKVKTNPELTHASDALDYIVDYEFQFDFDTKERLIEKKIGV